MINVQIKNLTPYNKIYLMNIDFQYFSFSSIRCHLPSCVNTKFNIKIKYGDDIFSLILSRTKLFARLKCVHRYSSRGVQLDNSIPNYFAFGLKYVCFLSHLYKQPITPSSSVQTTDCNYNSTFTGLPSRSKFFSGSVACSAMYFTKSSNSRPPS